MKYEAKQAVYLPLTDFLNLEFFLMDTRPGVKPGEFVAELVKRWLATETARLALRNGHAVRGFQWKNVFLPEGTALRTSIATQSTLLKLSATASSQTTEPD